MPWLVNTVVTGLAARGRQEVLDGTVTAVMGEMAKPHKAALEKEAARQAVLEEAERRFRKELAEELRLKEQLRARMEKEANAMKEFDEYIEPIPEPTTFILKEATVGEDGTMTV